MAVSVALAGVGVGPAFAAAHGDRRAAHGAAAAHGARASNHAANRQAATSGHEAALQAPAQPSSPTHAASVNPQSGDTAAQASPARGNRVHAAGLNPHGHPSRNNASLLAAVTPTAPAQPARPAAAPGPARGFVAAFVGAVHTTSLPAALPRAPGAPPAPAPQIAAIDNEPMVLASGGWQGVSLQAALNLRIPLLFGAAVLLFVLLQALVDRRDPKVSQAPERGDEDTVGFS